MATGDSQTTNITNAADAQARIEQLEREVGIFRKAPDFGSDIRNVRTLTFRGTIEVTDGRAITLFAVRELECTLIEREDWKRSKVLTKLTDPVFPHHRVDSELESKDSALAFLTELIDFTSQQDIARSELLSRAREV